MESELRRKIINELVGDIPLNEKIIKLFERVRDISYGSIGSRDPKDVYEKSKGTCSGKHELLKELYQELGIEVKDFIAMHKFNDLNVDFPDNIKEILNRTEIIDPHNFFKIKIDDNWITIDITWDKPLKRVGFPITEDWDGKSDMELCVVPIKIIEIENPIEMKKQKISELPEKVQKDRKLFLNKLTEWLDTVR